MKIQATPITFKNYRQRFVIAKQKSFAFIICSNVNLVLSKDDGMNMNKVIKNFQDSLVKNKLKDADHKINYLELSIDKVKKENKNMKNNNGSKEALRIEVEKCHTIIENLKKENR
jgi:hypothetical protein